MSHGTGVIGTQRWFTSAFLALKAKQQAVALIKHSDMFQNQFG